MPNQANATETPRWFLPSKFDGLTELKKKKGLKMVSREEIAREVKHYLKNAAECDVRWRQTQEEVWRTEKKYWLSCALLWARRDYGFWNLWQYRHVFNVFSAKAETANFSFAD